MHADPTEGDAGGAHPSNSAPDRQQLLQRLEVLELQKDLDAQNIARLQEQNKELEDALAAERACGEKHAEALMGIQRTCDDALRNCDNLVDDLKMQHARAIARLEDAAAAKEVCLQTVRVEKDALTAEIAALKAATAATTVKLEREKAALEAQVALLQAQSTSRLADIHNAIGALYAFLPPLPPLLALAAVTFDRDWCTAACGPTWNVDVPVAANGMRAHVTRKSGGDGSGYLTLRGAAPLPRRPSPVLAANGRQQEQLPACRVVIEAYGQGQWCALGFVPSHHVPAGAAAAAAAVNPVAGRSISGYTGWRLTAFPSKFGDVSDGWTTIDPTDGGYATTSKVPAAPAGSAVEFAVDYAAGTCRVAFYTPAAVAGGFVEAPHAKMELRFVVTERPLRPIPTRADSGVDLYPAATTFDAGAIWRFAS
jgi:hypothetical protein